MSDASPRRIGVISDIHGNYHALTAVLDVIDNLKVEKVICLGDVVGYGAMPNECINLLRDRDIPTLAGNHDHAAVGMTDTTYFNDIAKRAIQWTKDCITEENAAWLKERPYVIEISPHFYFVHASPREPKAWNYVLTFSEAREAFEEFDQDFCFIGHSHQPVVVEKNGDDLTCPEDFASTPIKAGCRYLINVGSVGQPRDHNPAGCFVHVDLDSPLIRFTRVDYEIEAAKDAIMREDLPWELADRLSYGW